MSCYDDAITNAQAARASDRLAAAERSRHQDGARRAAANEFRRAVQGAIGALRSHGVPLTQLYERASVRSQESTVGGSITNTRYRYKRSGQGWILHNDWGNTLTSDGALVVVTWDVDRILHVPFFGKAELREVGRYPVITPTRSRVDEQAAAKGQFDVGGNDTWSGPTWVYYVPGRGLIVGGDPSELSFSEWLIGMVARHVASQ